MADAAWIRARPLSRPRVAWFAVNIAVGVVVMLAGLISATQELVESSGGLFAGSCKLLYSYAPSDPDSTSPTRHAYRPTSNLRSLIASSMRPVLRPSGIDLSQERCPRRYC